VIGFRYIFLRGLVSTIGKSVARLVVLAQPPRIRPGLSPAVGWPSGGDNDGSGGGAGGADPSTATTIVVKMICEPHNHVIGVSSTRKKKEPCDRSRHDHQHRTCQLPRSN
jgi:hypothetical protein